MGASASLKKGNTSDDESDDDISAPEGDDTAGSSPAPHTSFFKIKKKEKHGTFFTSEELQEIKEMEEMQKKVTSFISKHFFYAVSSGIFLTTRFYEAHKYHPIGTRKYCSSVCRPIQSGVCTAKR